MRRPLGGAAPVPASSGKTHRHRLSRGGDRAANAALDRIALVRMASGSRTRDYVTRQTAASRTKKEIILRSSTGAFSHDARYRSRMSPVNLRQAVRAIILDQDDRILLCRFAIPKPEGTIVVWAAPGGGVETGETLLTALRRELLEEVGLTLDADPPHVWHQEVIDPGHANGYDGVINDYFLIRTAFFNPRGALSDDELAAENITRLEWWRPQDITGYHGTDLFSPRDLATPLATLISSNLPDRPVPLGL